jgi:hypothetical protein
MSKQYEVWYFIKNGILYRHTENDGHTALRRGLESVNEPLCYVEEAKTKFPDELAQALKE